MALATAPRRKIGRRRAALVARQIRVVRARLRPRVQEVTERFFRAQTREAARRFVQRPPGSTQLVPDSDVDRILVLVRPMQLRMMGEAVAVADDLLGKQLDEDDIDQILRGARTRFANVNQRTQGRVTRLVTEGVREGLATTEIAANIRGLGPKMAGRAGTIARTEMAMISNEASFSRFGRGGITEVDIADGSECGWTEHDDGDQADGSRRSLAAARAQPLSHPNCERVPIPVI